MKILMMSYEYPPLGGGGSKVVDGLSKELVSLGHSIDVVTMGFRGLPKHEEVKGVQVYRIPCVRRKRFVCTAPEVATYMFSAIQFVHGLIKKHRYDFIHAHFIFPDGMMAWRLTRKLDIPYIITAHGSDVPGYNPHRLKLAHKLLAPLWKSVTRLAAEIVCPSESLKMLVKKHERNTNISVISNGFDTKRFITADKTRRILVVTRMLERKGIQYLIEALKSLKIEHEVVIVGDGPYLPVLQQMAQLTNTPVKFMGWMENDSYELKKLYETSDIFVFPSEAENFPICLLEAMAAEMAIITSKGTGCAEVVGDEALLVAPKNPTDIRNALEILTRDEKRCRELGVAARKRFEKNFSWPVVAKRYIKVYKKHTLEPVQY
jgi:glycosyltransferase involved in cell wall biosynthesis